MRKQIDTLNKKLRSYQEETGPDTYALYDSVAEKYGKVFLEEFRYTVTDSKNYLKYLKSEFIVRRGGISESTMPEENDENLDITDQFFIKEKNGENLYYKLDGVQKALSGYNNDPVLSEEINKMTWAPKGKGASAFANAYFNKVPPVAAMTILSKFENDINKFEKKVLQQILKTANVTPR